MKKKKKLKAKVKRFTTINPEALEEPSLSAKSKKSPQLIGVYNTKVVCDNCGFSGVMAIQKGRRIIDEKCPGCGCTDLEAA